LGLRLEGRGEVLLIRFTPALYQAIGFSRDGMAKAFGLNLLLLGCI
jgi:hypothetical protein